MPNFTASPKAAPCLKKRTPSGRMGLEKLANTATAQGTPRFQDLGFQHLDGTCIGQKPGSRGVIQ